MQDSTFTTRLRIGIASLAALVALVSMAAFAGVAKAGAPAFDPETTNIPYLAWRGTEVRLVKCFAPNHPGANAFASRFIVELWSGDAHERPQFAAAAYEGAESGDSTTHEAFEGTGEQAGLNCFATDIVSQKPGLAMVKMKATAGGPGTGAPLRVVAEHQFLVGWMDINSATMRDIGLTTSTAGQTAPTGGQPSGGGINQAQVLVTGRIAMMGNLGDELNAGMGRAAGTPLVMPNDWPALARRFARTAIEGNERNAMTWDIHDEFTPTLAAPPGTGQTVTQHLANHQVGGACPGTSTTIDVVDNCLGGGEFGPFSRFVHGFAGGTPDMTVSTVGPFDPKRPGHFGIPNSGGSYLPDGVLDMGDAPMPAIRVDYHLAGAGQFVPVDKHNVYQAVLGGESPDTGAHNLYGPFYGAFIPATAAERGATATTGGSAGTVNPQTGVMGTRGPVAVNPAIPATTASGTDTGVPNNFTGYTINGLYHFWDFAVAVGRTGAAVNCPPFVGGNFGLPAGDPGRPPAATLPSGNNEVQVYTDEHGEARVGFLPGIGFNFAALATTNLNRGCDIQGVGTLGTATITADVRYPAQPVTAPDVGVGTITKTITSLFNKQIACVPKGPGVFNAVTFVCTATAIGITGTPFVNETVCFATNA